MSVTVAHLLKKYGHQTAVNNVSFQLSKGEIVGFLGPNGAGKSTTMKMITGYLVPDEGSIQVAGFNITQNPLEAKQKIGYLPEANPLYYDMYIREYLDFISRIHHIPHKKERIEWVIEKVGLTPEAHKKTGQLSKGYKQRVGLAAAIIHDPEVLILDEPTSGLDPNQIIEIRSVIRELSENKTILFSSHIMQEVEALCSRVIIINKGNIVADNSLQELKQMSNDQMHIITVQFSAAVANTLLQQLPGILKIETTGPATYQLYSDQPEVVRQHLLQLGINEKLNIISLNSYQQNLETVFKRLTS